MTDSDLWAAFRVWAAIGGAIVVVAAALLVTILVVARQILAEAVRALNAVERIRTHTQPLWELQATNEVAARMLATVDGIAAKGTALVDALQGTAVGGRHAK